MPSAPSKSFAPVKESIDMVFGVNGPADRIKENLWSMYRDSLDHQAPEGNIARADLFKSLCDLIDVMSEYSNQD